MKPECEHLNTGIKSPPSKKPKKPDAETTASGGSGSSSLGSQAATAQAVKRGRPEEEVELPKKCKSAFNFFVKAKRKETEVELGEVSVDVLKAELLKKWDLLDQAGKTGKFIALAEEDKKRYERDQAEFAKFISGKKK